MYLLQPAGPTTECRGKKGLRLMVARMSVQEGPQSGIGGKNGLSMHTPQGSVERA